MKDLSRRTGAGVCICGEWVPTLVIGDEYTCSCGRVYRLDADDFDADELGLDPEEPYDA